jgi:3-hydroxyacyl-CoA dehydrogenase
MLWGALGGAAKAGMQVMDDRVKAQADERKRVQSIADRRAELDREMDRKIEYARSEKEAEAQGFEQASDGGRKIANERGAAEMERGRGMLPSSGEFANDRITPEMIADQKQRLLFRQAVEVARCWEEGVIDDPREADVGAILAWGFAPWTGGPITYIDQIGLKAFVAQADDYAARYGDRFKVPQLLRDMAAKGETFYGNFAGVKTAA